MSSALALPDAQSRATIVRAAGVYIAVAAGAIQLVDILADRAGLPDRAVAFIIVLAVVGLPIAVVGALMLDIARADRTGLPVIRRTVPASPVGTGATAVAAIGETRIDAAAATWSDTVTLPRRLELALSYRRLAELHRHAGFAVEAEPLEARFDGEIGEIIAALQELRRAAARSPAPPPDSPA